MTKATKSGGHRNVSIPVVSKYIFKFVFHMDGIKKGIFLILKKKMPFLISRSALFDDYIYSGWAFFPFFYVKGDTVALI